MSPRTRRLVRDRAGRRCEYCLFHEEDLPLWPFHLDHIIAGQHAGSDNPPNLAWACQRCNLCKGTNLSAIHFKIESDRITGSTPTGRATVWLLQMNTPERMELRAELKALARWPAAKK